MATYIVVTIIAYLLGSISFSVIISKKMAGFDVREKGSGNAGSTNVLRTVGKKAAAITLVVIFAGKDKGVNILEQPADYVGEFYVPSSKKVEDTSLCSV